MSPNLSPKTIAHRVGERWLIFFFVVTLLGAAIGGWALLGRLSTPAPITIIAPPTAQAANAPVATSASAPSQLSESIPLSITVMVAGAVQKPGLYPMPAKATAADAIAMAGGFSEQAEQSLVNLAEPMQDGTVLTIPSRAGDAENSATLLNLNTATSAELETLPGIGPATAQAIIDHRPYRRLSDLNNVPGIGEVTINRLRGLITVDNEFGR